MLVDPRHDHSLRVPRPGPVGGARRAQCVHELPHGSQAGLGGGEGAELVRPTAGGYQRFAEAFHQAETGASVAIQQLTALARDTSVPGIVRASALARMPADLGRSPAGADAVTRAAGDADPLVRRAALAALELLPPDARIAAAVPLLSDPVRASGSRRRACWRRFGPRRSARTPARPTSARPPSSSPPSARTRIGRSIGPTSERSSRPEDGSPTPRRSSARRLTLDRTFVPAYVNLADLYRAEQREP